MKNILNTLPITATAIMALLIWTDMLQCSWWWALAPLAITLIFVIFLMIIIWILHDHHGGMHR